MAYGYGVWIVIFFLISFALGCLYGPITRSQACRLIFLPAFLAFSIAKAIACAITGTKIKEFAPFGDDTDLVGYNIRTAGWWRVMLVNLVTYMLALSLLIVIAWACESRIGYRGKLPVKAKNAEQVIHSSAHFLVDAFLKTTKLVWKAVGRAIFKGDMAVLLYLYFVVGLLLAMPTPKEEFKYGLLGAVLLGLVILGFTALFLLRSEGQELAAKAWAVLSFATAMTLYLLGASLIGVGGLRIFGLVKQKPPKRDDD
jgi:hypothetical protein